MNNELYKRLRIICILKLNKNKDKDIIINFLVFIISINPIVILTYTLIIIEITFNNYY
jgi:hypothetical protein